jgi:hypothetical protein
MQMLTRVALQERHWDTIRVMAAGALSSALPSPDAICLAHLAPLGLPSHEAKLVAIMQAAEEEAAAAALQAQASVASDASQSSALSQ